MGVYVATRNFTHQRAPHLRGWDVTEGDIFEIEDADLAEWQTEVDNGSIAESTLYSAGGTDVAVADGGTGASTAAGARTNLDVQRKATFDVRDYGAVGDGTTDDTTAVQAAITAASAAGGGQVLLPEGTWIVSGITLPSKVQLVGVGWSSILKLKSASNGPVVRNAALGTEWVGIFNLCIDGNTSGQSSDSPGIKFDHTGGDTPGTFTFADPHHLVSDVLVRNVRGHGVHLDVKASETRLRNVVVHTATKHGFYLAWGDNFLSDCTAIETGQDGFHLTSAVGSTRLVACKSFYCGTAMASATDQGHGFHIAGSRNQLSACEAQDNYGHGFSIVGNNNVIDTALSDSNGQYAGLTTASGVYLKNAQYNTVHVIAGNRDAFTRQDYGAYLDFATGSCYGNKIRITPFGTTGFGVNVWSVGTGTNNQVEIGASGGMARTGTGVALDAALGTVGYFILTANVTIDHVANRWPGMVVTYVFQQDGTGGRTVTWGASGAYKVPAGWSPVTTANKTNSITFMFDGLVYRCMSFANDVAA